MPTGSTDINPFNRSFYRDRMEEGLIIPVISNEALLNHVIGGYESLVRGYADHIEYPLDDRDHLFKMAKYRSINNPDESDDPWRHLEIGTDYLYYVKKYLLRVARGDGVHPDSLRIASHEQHRLSPSEFADRLGYPDFLDKETDALQALAGLPSKIIMTTCCHTFIEAALRRAGKEPRSDFCRWHEEVDASHSVFDDGYEPCETEPLVYHLHGMDTEKSSLVLAEDDYLDFLIATTQDRGKDVDRIPGQIRQAVAQSAVVLLGFELNSWAFRVFLWGLIRHLRAGTKGLITLQIEPDEVEQAFLRTYFRKKAFLDIYWGSILDCIQKLGAQWGAQP
jgi:hypothetical protein